MYKTISVFSDHYVGKLCVAFMHIDVCKIMQSVERFLCDS